MIKCTCSSNGIVHGAFNQTQLTWAEFAEHHATITPVQTGATAHMATYTTTHGGRGAREIELVQMAGATLEEDRFLRGEQTPVYFGSALTNFALNIF